MAAAKPIKDVVGVAKVPTLFAKPSLTLSLTPVSHTRQFATSVVLFAPGHLLGVE